MIGPYIIMMRAHMMESISMKLVVIASQKEYVRKRLSAPQRFSENPMMILR